jgi:hypothetical protein
MRSSRGVAIRLVVLCVVVVVALWMIHERTYKDLRNARAITVAACASLMYLRQHGEPPKTVDDLLEGGLLRSNGQGEVFVPGFGAPARLDYVRRVRLSFPNTAESYELRGGVVVSKDSGRELVCVDIDGERANDRDWAYLWFCVANGRSTGVDWLDELLSRDR